MIFVLSDFLLLMTLGFLRAEISTTSDNYSLKDHDLTLT